MPHPTGSLQQKTFERKVRAAFSRKRAEIRSVSALARKLRRPRTSVSRAINQDIFPDLQRQISRALGI